MDNLLFITDPGHGWLRVPMAQLKDSGYQPSGYSFLSDDKQFAFLEEDCDATGFLNAAYGDKDNWPTFPEQYIEKGWRRPVTRFG